MDENSIETIYSNDRIECSCLSSLVPCINSMATNTDREKLFDYFTELSNDQNLQPCHGEHSFPSSDNSQLILKFTYDLNIINEDSIFFLHIFIDSFGAQYSQMEGFDWLDVPMDQNNENYNIDDLSNNNIGNISHRNINNRDTINGNQNGIFMPDENRNRDPRNTIEKLIFILD